MAKYQAYAEYKGSEVEWLGNVPQHWALVPCRAVVDHIVEKNSNNAFDNYLSLMANIGVIKYEDKGDVGNKKPDDLSKCKIVRKGQLVINSMNYAIGSYGMSPYDGICSPVYIVLQAKKDIFLERFALRIFENTPFQKYLATFGNGILEHRAAINWEDIKNKYVPLPTLDEQKNILDFLDYETVKIDHLIEKQQQLIELLKEKRQAVISHAVTKGLDPNVPMKDSGVEWLGKVPEHWDTASLKYLCELLKDGTHLPPARVDSGVPLLSVRNIINNKFTFRDDDSQISESSYADLCKSFIPQNGDVLLAIVGATLGKVAVIEQMENFHIQRSLGIFRTKKTKLNNYFLAYLFSSKGFQSLLWENVGFSAQPGIYLGALSNFLIPVPSIEEQKNIIDFIKKQLDKFDNLINKALHSVQLMQERRTALISAAVTGKIDVRNWQAPTLAGAQTELSA